MLHPRVSWLLLLTLAACPMMDDDDAGDEGGTATPALEGTVARGESAAIAEGGDGIGTVYIAAFESCALDATLLGATAIPNADLSDPNNAVDFTIMDLPEGEVHLAFFLDDNGDADGTMPLPGPGDLVYADGVGDGVLSCVAALVPGDEDGVELVINATVPLP